MSRAEFAANRRIRKVSLDPLLQGATTAVEGPGPTAAAETQRRVASASLSEAFVRLLCTPLAIFRFFWVC